MSPDHPEDLTTKTAVERSRITLEFWAKYQTENGDSRFASIVLQQQVGLVGTSTSERTFSITGAQTGTVTSEATTSMKTCITTSRKCGLYQLLMDKLKF